MKAIRYLSFFVISAAIGISPLMAQNDNNSDSTGMPGDNFSLEGALQLFKKASSPEEFEKLLNTEDNHVNNLDLDGDGDIDYIRVIEKKDKDAHVFILQVAVSEKENQDIAVIELEKTGEETAVLQIVGDEEIFGEQTIVEPGDGDFQKVSDNDENTKGPNDSYIPLENNMAVVNVWYWPSVRLVYAPSYRVWISPWRWHSYPGWWRPWRPMRWHVYHPYRVRYRPGFAVVHTHRVVYAHRVYTPYRATSVTVRTRNTVARKNYTVRHSRSTTMGPGGNSVTRKTTTVHSNHSKAKVSKTTVKKRKHLFHKSR